MSHNKKKTSLNKEEVLFLSVVIVLSIFLLRVFWLGKFKPDFFISTTTIKRDFAVKGGIISSDNQIFAKNEKKYDLAVFKNNIKEGKKELLINLLAIYTNTPKQVLLDKIKYSTTNRVILLENLPYKIVKHLKYLSTYLTIKSVFKRNKNGVVYGLDIYEKSLKRDYPLNDCLEPILGFSRLKLVSEDNRRIYRAMGQSGLEKYYESILKPKQNGYIKGYRDVQDNILYDNTVIIKQRIDGDNLYLNINSVFQRKVELMLDKLKKELKAKEILTAIMESDTGKIIGIASSNRYNPSSIRKKDIPNLKISHIQYLYEPGSVMKPITLAILLENKKVNPLEILNAHNGIFYFKKHFTIYDDEPFKWLNVIQAVVHSSNIVFAQLGLRLTPLQFREGLLKFGFAQKSKIDLPYEYKGNIFTTKELNKETHRASISFGYGLQVNLIQLLKAYNIFNNYGIMVTPRIANKYNNSEIPTLKQQIISPSTAKQILNILRKVVLNGTGKGAKIDGIWTAGKTGTAKISKNGKYIKGLYNSSFIGFANDKNHKYTIATLTIQPDKEKYFASQTSVVVFRNIVKIMEDMGFLINSN